MGQPYKRITLPFMKIPLVIVQISTYYCLKIMPAKGWFVALGRKLNDRMFPGDGGVSIIDNP